MIEKRLIKETEKGNLFSYMLDNGNGLKAEILNLGGIIRKLEFNGVDVVLGYDDHLKYMEDCEYIGAIIGRNANVIKNSKFTLNGKKYTVSPNRGKNNLHGGNEGFHRRLWETEMLDGEEPSLVLRLFSEDGEEGFPADVNVKVTYTLMKDNSLKIHYEGTSDGDTIMNLTNHSYFNLNGHSSGDVKNHTLQLDCGFYTPITKEIVPDGRVLSVSGTAFDFTSAKRIGSDMDMADEQIRYGKGYDHNFAINGSGMRRFATLEGDKTGIRMEVSTDRPAVQIYSGNGIGDTPDRKDGVVYVDHQGVCIETQAFPDFTEFSHFPDGFLSKGEKYDTTTVYKFFKITS